MSDVTFLDNYISKGNQKHWNGTSELVYDKWEKKIYFSGNTQEIFLFYCPRNSVDKGNKEFFKESRSFE